MAKLNRVGILVLVLVASSLSLNDPVAQGGPRFSSQKITRTEWTKLFDESRKLEDADVTYVGQQVVIETTKFVKYPDEHYLLAITTTYVFTSSNHPAHPAVVIHTSYTGPDQHTARREAYYAGQRSSFDAWLRRFRTSEYEAGFPK